MNLITHELYHQILTEGQKIGHFIGVPSKSKMFTLPGTITTLKEVPVGSLVHSVEIKPGKGSQISRSAGTSVKLLNKEPKLNLAKLKLPSKQNYILSLDSKCILGNVSNPLHNQKKLYKAGQSR